MNYWLADNEQRADENVLHMLIGHLRSEVQFKKKVSPASLLDLIQVMQKSELERLNEAFPDKAPYSA